MTRKLLGGLLALALLSGVALAADNVILDQKIGPDWQLRTTDQGSNVHVPHVITEGTAPSSSSVVAITPVSSGAAEGSHVLKASAGNLYGFSVSPGVANAYVMLFNATSAPADGAVTPVFCYGPLPNSPTAASWGQTPARFSTGIVIVLSTTGCFTKTIGSTAFFAGAVQ